MRLDSKFENERLAAKKNLGASDAEINAIMTPILGSGIRRDQIVEMARSAFADLTCLRKILTELDDMTSISAPVRQGMDKVSKAINAKDVVDVASATHALADLTPEKEPIGVRASIFFARGLTHRLCQEYRQASEQFTNAAAIEGLDQRERWSHAMRSAQALRDLGQEFLDDQALREAIEMYESRVQSLVPPCDSAATQAKTSSALGVACAILGQRQHGTKTLERAIEYFREAAERQDQSADASDWAATHNSLGNALGTLAYRQKDEEMLEQALHAFELALTGRPNETAPWDWATTQNNMGAVLQTLGQRKNDPQLLKRAVDAYKSVLLVWTRDRAPLHWATTFNNLGTALRTLGEKRKGPRTLEQAVAAYRNALAERTRERVPEQWAMTQNNLGAALQKLGERTEDIKSFNEAVTAYQDALKEWTQEKNPITWAMTTANLAVAQKSLAERLADPGAAKLALEYFESVAKAFREASHAQYYEFATEQIAKTRTLIDGLRAG